MNLPLSGEASEVTCSTKNLTNAVADIDHCNVPNHCCLKNLK